MSSRKRPRPTAGQQKMYEERTSEQTDWLRIMDRLRGRLGRRPTDAEVLAEALRMGYRDMKTWDEPLAKLKAMRALEADWDGQQSDPPPKSVIDQAAILAKELRDLGMAAPARVVSGVNENVLMEWITPSGSYLECEVNAERIELAIVPRTRPPA